MYAMFATADVLAYFRYLSKPSGNIGLYDPAEIHNRHQLSTYMTQCMVKLGFHLLFFFLYLYRFEHLHLLLPAFNR